MDNYSPFFIYKMQGTGNDFLIVDVIQNQNFASIFKEDRPNFAKRLCDRKFGIGADGLLFLEPSQTLDFQWDFYNSDGSVAEMCGNATRCVALYAIENGLSKTEVTFGTLAGPITAHVKNGIATVETTPIETPKTISVENGTETIKISLIDSGVPHAVIETSSNDLQSESLRKTAAFIRNNEMVGSRGANVTYFKELSEGHIQSVSYERGVEAFTLACGTGVLAAGYSYCHSKGIKTCDVTVPGGQLRVDFQEKSPKLVGPAEFVGRIQISEKLLKG